jgi:hypothetical protein
MKLYKAFSMGLLALTAVSLTTLASSAVVGGRKPFVVAAQCGNQTASFNNGHLILTVDGFADDNAGFNIRPSFTGSNGGNNHGVQNTTPFPADNLTFTVTNLNGKPITGKLEAEAFLFSGNNEIFRKAKPDSNGRISLVFNNGSSHLNADEIAVVVNRLTGNSQTIVVTNFVLNGLPVAIDLQDTDGTFNCF